MEDNTSQQSRSASTQIKRLGDDVKAYLEGWYEDMGRPPVLSFAEKESIMHHIQNEIEPVGITIRQLNRWLTHRRRAERNSGRSLAAPRHKRFGMSILFPTLTKTELDHLKILVEENPNPSPDLLTVWVDSPLLPNVTLVDVHRFVKYNQAQMQNDHNKRYLSPAPKYGSHPDNAPRDADESNEEDMLDVQSYLMTAEPTSAELNSCIVKPDPFLSPTLRHPPTLLTTELPRDPRALLELLRSHLSPDELKQLLQEGSSDVTSMSRTSIPSVEPIVSNHLPSPESLPHSPISSSSHKSSTLFAHSRLSSPGEVIVSSDSTHNLARALSMHSSPPHTQKSYCPENPTVIPSPGIVSWKMFTDLSKFSLETTDDRISPDQFLERFELCQKKSKELTTALEIGHLRDFGMVPNEELKALRLPSLPELPSHVAPF